MNQRRNIAVLFGLGPRGKKSPPTQMTATTTAPKPTRSRDTTTGIDARQLSPDDYERRLAQLGLSPPGTDHRRLRPVNAEAQQEARRDLDRATRTHERDRVRADQLRRAELAASAVDGRSAPPSEVRARLAQLGVDASPAAVGVAEVGRGLEAPRNTEVDYSTRMATARNVMRSALDLCKRTGQHLDTRMLDAFEVAAYRQLRGLDPA